MQREGALLKDHCASHSRCEEGRSYQERTRLSARRNNYGEGTKDGLNSCEGERYSTRGGEFGP
jgi:hypothetical protein